MKCIKCGQLQINPRWHKDGDACAFGSQQQRSDEHLHYQCPCGYDWCDDVLDQEILDAVFHG